MSPSTSRIIACLEEVMFETPREERGVVSLAIKGLRGRRTPLATPFTNLVGVQGPGVEVPEASIDAAFAEFASRGLAFGWLVGPHSPPGLAERLASRGMVQVEQFRGLFLSAGKTDVPAPAEVSVREVGREQQDQFATLLSRAYGLPEEMVQFLCEILYFAGSEVRVSNYFAYIEGVEGPVGTASTLYSSKEPIAILAGSAILKAHRGRGAYRSLVRQRLQDIQREGIDTTVIQAAQSTSAPICRSLGFQEVCTQVLYAWEPPDASYSSTGS
jgi:hypothetical protein